VYAEEQEGENMINAIETRYKGLRFRSRLEARWAVFFDAMNYEWRYEEEGFELHAFNEIIRYLPDFHLLNRKYPGIYIEVKGSDDKIDQDKFSKMLDFGGILPHGQDNYDGQNGLIILGEIPNQDHGFVCHPIYQHHKGIQQNWIYFTTYGMFKVDYSFEGALSYFVGNSLCTFYGLEGSVGGFTCKHKFFHSPYHDPTVWGAYRKARQARFEHGETPA
jgi:hypothetical protein